MNNGETKGYSTFICKACNQRNGWEKDLVSKAPDPPVGESVVGTLADDMPEVSCKCTETDYILMCCCGLPIILSVLLAPHVWLIKRPHVTARLSWFYVVASALQTLFDVTFLFCCILFFWRFIPIWDKYVKAWKDENSGVETCCVLAENLLQVPMDIMFFSCIPWMSLLSMIYFWRVRQSFRLTMEFAKITDVCGRFQKLFYIIYHFWESMFELISVLMIPFYVLSPRRLFSFFKITSNSNTMYFGRVGLYIAYETIKDVLSIPVIALGMILSPQDIVNLCLNTHKDLHKALVEIGENELQVNGDEFSTRMTFHCSSFHGLTVEVHRFSFLIY
jgi:hypothetical protein